MVKNVIGGNKGKCGARKNASFSHNNKIRLVENEGEFYAIVIKMLGSGMFTAKDFQGKLWLGKIRGKFTGKKKRGNIITSGSIVLLGERSWDMKEDDNSDKMKKCDLLEIYTDKEKEQLKTTVNENWDNLTLDESVIKRNNENDDIFMNSKQEEIENILNTITNTNSTINNITHDTIEISIDDI